MALIESEIVEYFYQKADVLKIPLSGTFEISPICNMDCKMCYVKMPHTQVEDEGGLLSKETWIDIAQQAKKMGMLFILLTGGEPFFREDFRELYEELHEMGFVLSINSNGTMIDEDTVEWLKKMPPNRINITLYGASDETYKRLCQNPVGFTKVTKAIELLKAAGINIKLNASITQYNRDDLNDMMEYARDHDLIMEVTSYMFPPIRKDGTSIGRNDRLLPEEATDIFKQVDIYQRGEEYFEKKCKDSNDKKQELEKYLKAHIETEGTKLQCRAGSCTFWMTWDGRMLPCGMMLLPETFPLKDGFENAWNELKEKVDDIRLPIACNNCSDKEVCHTCAAMVYAETGSFDKKPEYRCRMTQHYNQCYNKIMTMNGKGNEE